ncbi:hypothetical protein Riv7116_2183 [Rivularia sp. PCC 7116]|uniref:DUF4330 domain-containing protein n=1 Tax=Rivularia sp. PCC 7116 TaxID=373994 RepID=UPI00029F0447|nr:DUF4330 domain-containing protein [Rivularia sp. PCC 7116]AFY54709.1 hypothetical protein Riv7116_2183 [Rivularia sp. PCC 7116]
MAIWNSNFLNYARVRRTLNVSLTSVIRIALTFSVMLGFIVIIFFSNISISQAQVNVAAKPIEVDLLVDGLSLLRPETLLGQGLKSGGKTNLTIENKPSGEMTIKSVKQLPITINVTQPDGSVKELPDPSAKFETDLLITLTGKAQIQNIGAVIGESLVKIGSPAKIEGFNYDINTTVVDLRMQQ